jgi:8-oxo-dGTP diphosphatase
MEKTSIACIALDGNNILIAHRNPTGQMGGRWEFPGGKLEPGETEQQAVVREFKEEFGVHVKVGEKITDSSFRHNGDLVALHAYRIFVPHRGIFFKYKLTEHTEYKWVKITDIPVLNFVDSDLRLYPEVKKYVETRKGK